MNKILVGALIIVGGLLFLSAPNVLAGPLEGVPCNGDFANDGDVDGEDLTEFLVHFGRGKYTDPCPFEPPSKLPKTGQTNSNDH